MHQILAVTMILALNGNNSIQQPPPDNAQQSTSAAGQFESFRSSLIRNHISVDYSSLIVALENTDPRIRSDAAGELAEQHMSNAVPALEAALTRESVAQIKVNIAASIGRLDAEKGKPELFALCQDQTVPDPARLDAARHLGDLKDGRCLTTIESIAKGTEETHVRASALSLLPQLARTFPQEKAGIVEFLTAFWKDPSWFIRSVTCESLEFAEGAEAVPLLQARLKVENDPEVIDQIHRSLMRLDSASSAGPRTAEPR